MTRLAVGRGAEGCARGGRPAGVANVTDRKLGMTVRIELDFRHGLTESRVERGPEGPRLSLARGQEEIAVLLPRHAIEALWLTLTHAITEAS
jgi:hypothetical protein